MPSKALMWTVLALAIAGVGGFYFLADLQNMKHPLMVILWVASMGVVLVLATLQWSAYTMANHPEKFTSVMERFVKADELSATYVKLRAAANEYLNKPGS